MKTTTAEINILYYVQFAKDYGLSIGLSYDSTATACWDNPIIVSSTNGAAAERDIKSRLNGYKNVEKFTYFCVWSQKRSDGKYDLYVGYA